MLRGYFWANMSTSHKTGSDIRLWTPLNKSTDLCQFFFLSIFLIKKQTKTDSYEQDTTFFELHEGKSLLFFILNYIGITQVKFTTHTQYLIN